MATVFQRGKKAVWYAQWRDAAGRTVQRKTGIAVDMPDKTPKETRKMAQQLADVMEQTAKGEQTMETMLDCVRSIAAANGMGKPMPSIREYLGSIPATSGASAEKNRQRAHKAFLEFLGSRADMRVDTITPAMCRKFLRWALELVQPSTVSQYRGYIAAALKRAVVEDRHLPHNPMDMANIGTEMRAMGIDEAGRKREPFSVEEMQRMLRDFPRPWRDMVAASYYLAGLRLSDVCMLRWSSVDFETGVVSLREIKTKRRRVISLLPVLRERLLTIRAEQGGEGVEEFVFPLMACRYQGQYSSRISTDFTALLKAYGIIGTEHDGEVLAGRRHRVNAKSFHSIRHSVVSFARINPQLTADMVREAVGHTSEAVERGYFAADDAAKAKVMAALNDAVKPAERDGMEGCNGVQNLQSVVSKFAVKCP